MSDATIPQQPSISKPAGDNRDDWKAYWQHLGQPWRTEPEITAERQAYLEERRAIIPDIQQGIYPFGGIPLSRADIEYLLATHEGRGPIDPNASDQQDRVGLDLRGVDLRPIDDISIDLSDLPLSRVRLGLTLEEWLYISSDLQAFAMVHMERANLSRANLQGANLFDVNLYKAVLRQTNLQGATLNRINLQDANLAEANLQNAVLQDANLHGASFLQATLQGADLRRAMVQNAYLWHANLRSVNLVAANLQGAHLNDSDLQNAVANSGTSLQDADLGLSNLQKAFFLRANFRGANLRGVNLRGTELVGANLQHADLRNTQLDSQTQLDQVQLDSQIHLADVAWDGANLVNVDWSLVTRLADETTAHINRNDDGSPKNRNVRIGEYRAAVRAYRLLTTALRDQGMLEEADRFAYRGQVCQRSVLRLQSKRGQYLWSGFLNLLAGYGYRPARTLVSYLMIIVAFATSFFFLAPLSSQHFSPLAALVMSVASFHGRGFFPAPNLPLDSPLAVAAAGEAILGLVIEASFIATFTQRYFGK